jgi:hypothetical protein
VLFQRFAALVDADRFLEFDVAPLEAADDRFEFLERALETHFADIGVPRFLGCLRPGHLHL